MSARKPVGIVAAAKAKSDARIAAFGVKNFATITAIAAEHCDVETLETRWAGHLDFHEVSAEGLRRALEAAFEAGRKAGSR